MLHGTQITSDPRYAPVPRDDFRPVAKQIAVEHDLDQFYGLGIPVDRFVALTQVLVALQFMYLAEYLDENGDVELSRFDAAARAVCAAFYHHPNAVYENDADATPPIIIWLVFHHGWKNIAPHLLHPLYHLVSTKFLNKRGPTISYLLDTPSPLPSGTPLTMLLRSQLAALLSRSFDFAAFRRTLQYLTSGDLPKTSSELIGVLEAIPEEPVLVFSP